MQTSSDESISVHNLDDSSLLTFKKITFNDGGVYSCSAKNDVSQVVRSTRIVVNVAPVWSLEPSDQNVQLGHKLLIDCSAQGYPPPTVSWKRDRSLIWSQSETIENRWPMGNKRLISESSVNDEGHHAAALAPIEFSEIISNYRQRIMSNGTIIIDQVDQTDAGQYMCEVANGIGSGLSKVFRVTINVPPYFRHKFSTQTAKINERVELRCLVFGDQPMIVGWQKGKQQIDLINDNRYIVSEHRSKPNIFESRMTINEADRNDSALYTCIATNQFGSDDTKTQLIIQEPPESPKELRPARVLSRSATLSFLTPFSGNNQIRRYLIQFKALLQLHMLDTSSSNATAPVQFDQTGHKINRISEGDWHQVAVDAPMGSATNLVNQDNILAKVELCCLQPFTKYLVRVIAKNDVGQSSPSEQIEFVTDEEVIGGPPLDVSVEATGAHSLKVKWRPPLAKLQHGMIRGYYIGYRSISNTYGNNNNQDSIIKSAMEFSGGDQTSYSDPSSVRSGVIIMNNGLSTRSDEEQYQYKNIQLDSGNGDLISPNLISDDGRKLGIVPESEERGDSMKDKPKIYSSYLTNLKRKSSYSIIVQAYNKVGAGPRSDQILISTLDAAPPTSPTVDIVSVSYDQVMLTWSRKSPINLESNIKPTRALIAEEDQDDPLAFYTIHYRDDKSMNNWQQKRIDRRQATPYPLLGLKCGSKHFIYMTATNSLGQSEPSETVATKTRGTPPIAANVQDFLFVNSTYVLLKLDTWHSSGCIIRSFTFKYKTITQKQWIILEHQVHPTVQTTTITGNAIFSTKSPSSFSNRQQNVDGASSEALTLSISPVHQIISDFVIRNLLSSTNYQLIVAASSDAGTTEIEYSFETANLSSSMVTIVSVNNQDGQQTHPIFVQSQTRAMSDISSNNNQHHFGLNGLANSSQLFYGNNMLRLCLVVGIILASVFLVIAFGWFIRKNKNMLMGFASNNSSNGSTDQHADNVSSYCPSHTNTISHYGAAESRIETLLHGDRIMNIPNGHGDLAQQLALNRLEINPGYLQKPVLNSNEYGQIPSDQSGIINQESDALQMNILDAVSKQTIDNQVYKTLGFGHRHMSHMQDTSINQNHDQEVTMNNGEMVNDFNTERTISSQQHLTQQYSQDSMNCKQQFIDNTYGRTSNPVQDCRLSTVNGTWRNIAPDQLQNVTMSLYAKPNKVNLNDPNLCQLTSNCDKQEEEPKLQSLAQSMSAHHLYAEPCAANSHRSKTLNTFINNRINAAVQMSLDDINARYGTIRQHRRIEQQNGPQQQDQVCSNYDLGSCNKIQQNALVQSNQQQISCQQQNSRNDLQQLPDYEQNSATILNPMTLNNWTLE